MNPPENKKHVLFGIGQIGTPLAKLLRDRGREVTIVRRSGGKPKGVAVIHGDASDVDFATEAAEGAAVVYHCMNPAYSTKVWARELPRLMESLIVAAGRANARLVVLDNLYMLGRPRGAALSESSPIQPSSKKGEIRARVHELLFDAHRQGRVRATCGRASDFYGPGGSGTYFGDQFWPGALVDGRPMIPVELDTPHSYHYTLDVAAGLVALGEAEEDVTGQWWMLPAAPADTTRGMVQRLGHALGRDLYPTRLDPWLFKIVGLVIPVVREINEMDYQWQEAFVVDDRRFRERFGASATTLDEGAPATVAWALRHYRKARKQGEVSQAADDAKAGD